MAGDNDSFFKTIRCRILLVLAVLAVIGILVQFGRLAFFFVKNINYTKIEAERGAIVDRNGAPLAVQTVFYDIGYTPSKVKNPDEFAGRMAPVLGLSKEAVLSNLSEHDGKKFAYLRKKVDQSVYQDVKTVTDEFGYNYVTFDKVPGRIYPNHSLASHLIGYMGNEGKGMSGIEYSQHEILASREKDGIFESGKNVYLTNSR